jgi:hypothetical protein
MPYGHTGAARMPEDRLLRLSDMAVKSPGAGPGAKVANTVAV